MKRTWVPWNDQQERWNKLVRSSLLVQAILPMAMAAYYRVPFRHWSGFIGVLLSVLGYGFVGWLGIRRRERGGAWITEKEDQHE